MAISSNLGFIVGAASAALLGSTIFGNILVLIGSIILGANFILLVSNEVSVVYCAAVLFALGNGLMWPSVLSLLSRRAGSIHQGAVQGIAGSFGSLASIIGLTVGGILYHFLGGAIFLISAAVIFAVFILSFRLLRIKKDGL